MDTAHPKVAVLIPAAGCGARTGLEQNKILAPLCGSPLLSWTLRAFLEAAPLLLENGFRLHQILIAARREEFDLIAPLVTEYSPLITVVKGGKTRQQSVWNAARAADSKTDYFLIHDAARPLVSSELIVRVCRAASTHGAAIAATPASDTIKITRAQMPSKNGARLIESTPDRATIYHAQTPQVFRREVFMEAFSRAGAESFDGTDCASVVERNGARVAIVEGEIENFKVTFAEDLARAENVLRARGRVT